MKPTMTFAVVIAVFAAISCIFCLTEKAMLTPTPADAQHQFPDKVLEGQLQLAHQEMAELRAENEELRQLLVDLGVDPE